MQSGHLRAALLKKEVKGGKYLVFFVDVTGKGYQFRAGKYATVSISSGEDDDYDLRRIFSISSPPGETGYLRFATTIRGDSDFKNRLMEMELGEKVDISPPLGGFFLISDTRRPVVFITSQIGITPVASIIGNEAALRSERIICLVYANQTAEDELFAEELENYRSTLDNYSISRLVSMDYPGNMGRIFSPNNLRQMFHGSNIDDAMFYVSGKPDFVNEVRRILTDNGIGSASIKTERFSGY